MSSLTAFITGLNSGKVRTGEKTVRCAVNEVISYAFRAIYDELIDLQNDVNSGHFSNQEIYDRIQEILDEL